MYVVVIYMYLSIYPYTDHNFVHLYLQIYQGMIDDNEIRRPDESSVLLDEVRETDRQTHTHIKRDRH